MRKQQRTWALLATTVLLGCSSGQGDSTSRASGGARGLDGALPSSGGGGSTNTGGSSALTSSMSGGAGGGASGGAAGGRVSSVGGNSSGTGGTGGTFGTGGSSARGGTSGSGGLSSTGGTAKGGSSAFGGTSGLGGSSGVGGAPARDGGAGNPDASARDAGGGGDPNPGVLAGTPPMGWNSWNAFACDIDEARIKAAADALVSSGMKDAGYQYVNVDDCWMNGRDSSGNIQYDKSKFPSGISGLASYVHGKGLKFGIYSAPNTGTCEGLYGDPSKSSVYVGSLNHEQQDAKSYASWGVDLLKYDDCGGAQSAFAPMRDALRATGRPIVYSINPYNGATCVPTGAHSSTCGLDLASIANMWRVSADIKATWNDIIRIVDIEAPLSAYAGPGHWNDPDMLEVGNGSLTETENRAHFSLWAMFAAPLIAGNDLTTMSASTEAILTNAEVIAVDQDPLGNQAKVVATPQTGLQVWSKTLTGDARAVALFNRNGSAANITVTFTQVGLSSGKVNVRDLWQKADLGSVEGSYTATDVPSHGVVMLRLSQ